jgi:hypothetical protein
MITYYLPFVNKYLTKYHNKAIGVGDTPIESITMALETLQEQVNTKYIWKTNK